MIKAITSVYEANKESIKTTKFILCTDGQDNGSKSFIYDVIDLIKKMEEIDLTIITLDVVDCGFDFRSVNEAFAKTKDLLIVDNFKTVDIREMFNIY